MCLFKLNNYCINRMRFSVFNVFKKYAVLLGAHRVSVVQLYLNYSVSCFLSPVSSKI